MKISVLGNIIDTELIYNITPIKESDRWVDFKFFIKFFNDKELLIERTSNCYIYDGYIIISGSNSRNPGNIEDIHNSEHYKKALKEITTLRDAIIAYWSNNQSAIPKLEFV